MSPKLGSEKVADEIYRNIEEPVLENVDCVDRERRDEIAHAMRTIADRGEFVDSAGVRELTESLLLYPDAHPSSLLRYLHASRVPGLNLSRDLSPRELAESIAIYSDINGDTTYTDFDDGKRKGRQISIATIATTADMLELSLAKGLDEDDVMILLGGIRKYDFVKEVQRGRDNEGRYSYHRVAAAKPDEKASEGLMPTLDTLESPIDGESLYADNLFGESNVAATHSGRSKAMYREKDEATAGDKVWNIF